MTTLVTLATMVTRVRKELLDEGWEDYLTASVADATTTSVSVNSGSSWAEGDVLEFRDSTLEQVKVRVGGTSPLTVKRGHNDTTAAAHSNGTTALKNSRISGDTISEKLTRVCYDSWPQAWQVKTASITPVANTFLYALDAGTLDLVGVTQKETGTPAASFSYGTRGSGYPVGLEFNVDPTISASGIALRIGGLRNATNNILVYARAILDTNFISEGLMADCLVMGTVARIMGMRQVQRSGMDLRQAEPGLASAYLQDAGYYQSEYQRLLHLLHLQLLAQGTTTPMRTWG
jgi:hypothetical protein